MLLGFTSTKAQLKVFSQICSNLTVVWIVAAFAAPDVFVLIRNILSAILMWYVSIKTEELLEEL
jgi:hypothetical protein